MNFINYSLAAVIAYLGLFSGFILALIAKEELKEAKKYLIFFQKITLLFIFIFLLVFIKLNYLVVLLIIIFVMIYFLKGRKEFNELPYIYIILSAIFYLSSRKLNLFVIESSLVFLYGLPTGSLLMKKNWKETLINILKNGWFVLIAISLFLIF